MIDEPWQLRQPDGEMVDVRVFGDEYYQVIESVDGFTLIRDPGTRVIVYARVSADRTRLESTGVRVGTTDPSSLGLFQHERIDRTARDKQAAKMRGLAGVAMPGLMPQLAAPPETAVGNVTALVLLIDFDDNVGTIAAADVDDYLNMPGYSDNGNNGSVRDYFLSISDNLLDYSSYVTTAYHRATEAYGYYDDCTDSSKVYAREMIKEALDALDAGGHDFTVYDSNNDGYIDALNVFYANKTLCGWSTGLWPSSSGMKDEWTSSDGIATNRYQITGMGDFLTLGTYCHENGHMVCQWPDLYDYDFDSKGAGRWCVMASQFSLNPQEPCAFLKQTAGWATPTEYASDQANIIVGPSGNNGNSFKFVNPGNAKEYFMVENRRRTGRDAELPGDGLVFYHIDEDGSNSNNEMTAAKHFRVTVMQADGLWELENDLSNGDADDPFAAPKYTAISPCTNPSSAWWDGSASNFNFNNISASATNMTFDFSIGEDGPTAVTKSYATDANTDCCIFVTPDDVNDGSYDPQGPGDIKSMKITAIDGDAITPTNFAKVCGDGFHTVTLTVTDYCDNTSSEDATVEVVNSPPITVCKDFTADADDNCCITVNLTDIDDGSYDPDGGDDIKSFGITAVDGSGITLTNSVSVCGNGAHTVTITMTDWCDSTSSCDATVNVVDVTPPDLIVQLDRDALWPPNHKLADIVATVEVTDNCDDDPYWELESITSNEPDNGLGDGDTAGDIVANVGTEDVDFQLRSERSGGQAGRKYTIIYMAMDESGNIARDTSCVTVPHDMGAGGVAANGFNANGTSLNSEVRTYALVVPSTEAVYDYKGKKKKILLEPAFDATILDGSRAYVGNTAGSQRPLKVEMVDYNDDGLKDLAVYYSAESTRKIIEASDALDGPVGLHLVDVSGDSYLVRDIFTLGEPIELEINKETKEYTRDDGPMVVSERDETPTKPGIVAIYPNPFNPATTISFQLASDADVKVAIYDVRGTLVRVLVSGYLPSGAHTAAWDGLDAQGRPSASGVYFARMVMGGFQETKKMVLLK